MSPFQLHLYFQIILQILLLWYIRTIIFNKSFSQWQIRKKECILKHVWALATRHLLLVHHSELIPSDKTLSHKVPEVIGPRNRFGATIVTNESISFGDIIPRCILWEVSCIVNLSNKTLTCKKQQVYYLCIPIKWV